jgi:hypothetical protein
MIIVIWLYDHYMRTTISIPDDLGEYAKQHAPDGNVSAYVAQLIERERAAEMWRRSQEELASIGVTPEWAKQYRAAIEATQQAHLRQIGLIK